MSSVTGLPPLIPESAADDRSGHGQRQAIGWLGALLPLLVVLLDRWRPTEGLRPEELTSVSAYYYSEGIVAFTGILCALAVFLITYRGYANRGWRDRWASSVAGWAAVLVAVFPTRPPGDTPRPAWWFDIIGVVHYAAAVALFGSFMYFCFVLFRQSDKPREEWDRDKRVRNGLYLLCGTGMLGFLIWAVIAGSNDRPIFVQEMMALELFAVSWLVKGRADYTALRTARRTLRYVGHPGDAVADLKGARRNGGEET